jgi:hypothetical protein
MHRSFPGPEQDAKHEDPNFGVESAKTTSRIDYGHHMMQPSPRDQIPAGVPVRIIDGRYAQVSGTVIGIRQSDTGLVEYKVLLTMTQGSDGTSVEVWVPKKSVELVD